MTFPDLTATFLGHGKPIGEDSWYHWIVAEKHLDCAWPLAEKAAKIACIDEMRVDIFISKGKPTECVINENSLSSGIPYGPLWGSMAKLWAEPHLTGDYQAFVLDHKRVYEHTIDDVPNLRAQYPKADQ